MAGAVRAALTRDDDYATVGKPPCDWDDPKARQALLDALVRDAHAALAALDGHELDGQLAEAASCWGWWPARTSRRARTGFSASPARWLAIG